MFTLCFLVLGVFFRQMAEVQTVYHVTEPFDDLALAHLPRISSSRCTLLHKTKLTTKLEGIKLFCASITLYVRFP